MVTILLTWIPSPTCICVINDFQGGHSPGFHSDATTWLVSSHTPDASQEPRHQWHQGQWSLTSQPEGSFHYMKISTATPGLPKSKILSSPTTNISSSIPSPWPGLAFVIWMLFSPTEIFCHSQQMTLPQKKSWDLLMNSLSGAYTLFLHFGIVLLCSKLTKTCFL